MQSSPVRLKPKPSEQGGGNVGSLLGNAVGGFEGDTVGSFVASGGVNLPSQTSSDHVSLKVL
jgi:outer membrane lipoprotein SlyB